MFSEMNVPRRTFYFVGIGGVSMSALAQLLTDRGYFVRGSDAQESAFTAKLRARGIAVHIGADEEISEDIVVYTGAVDGEHPQVKAAGRAGKRLMSRAELLGRIAEGYPHVLSVAGCHGKTTASCMLAHIFWVNGKPFACHIGGEDLDLGNYTATGNRTLVTEACEFRRAFLTLKSEIAVVLNCDLDHTDCYHSDGELAAAYAQFAAQAQKVVVNADDPRARALPHTLDFGFYNGDIRAERLCADRERYTFTVTERGVPAVRVRLNVVGRVNILNALAAYAAARLCGFGGEEIKRGLESFRGVKRRFEQVGTIGGMPVVCDYAHHPREIAATLKTALRLAQGNVRLVFQPHTYTRTRDLMGGFVDVLRRADRPIIYRTYAAREPFDFAGSAVALTARLADAVYVQSPRGLRARLTERAGDGDLILALGAGDIYEIVKSILDG